MSNKLIALPFQILAIEDGVMIKRGTTEIRIASKAVGDILQTIYNATKDKAIARLDLLQYFSETDRQGVDKLIDNLIAHRLMVSEGEYGSQSTCSESNPDIFYWHFGERTSVVTERINSQRIAIMGVNTISRHLAVSLTSTGIDIRVIDCLPLRNQKMFDNDGALKKDEWPIPLLQPLDFKEWLIGADSCNCLVAASDFGDQLAMRDLNRACVMHTRHFFPIVLKNFIGSVGPLVVPNEGPCFECLLARQNSHLDNPDVEKMTDNTAFEGQITSGFHPMMAAAIADIAAFELIKFYGGPLPGYNIGTLIEINLLATQMIPRKVLKIPGCLVCSRSMATSSTTPYKDVFSESADE